MNVERILLASSVVLTVLFTVTAIFAVLLVSKTLLSATVGIGVACWLTVLALFIVFILNNTR